MFDRSRGFRVTAPEEVDGLVSSCRFRWKVGTEGDFEIVPDALRMWEEFPRISLGFFRNRGRCSAFDASRWNTGFEFLTSSAKYGFA